MKNIFYVLKNFFLNINWFVVLNGLILYSCGLVAIFSATRSFNSDKMFKVQIIAGIIGIIAMFVIANINLEFLEKLYIPIFIVCVILLATTVIFGIVVNGNRNWIRFGSINFQPSELVKIGFILTFASHLNKISDNINTIKNLSLLAIHAGIISIIILLQGDLGSTLVFFAIIIAMIFAAGVKKRIMGLGFLSVMALVPLIWLNFLSNGQKSRILVGFNPDLDIQGWGYQAYQSRQAIGSGGIIGKGFLQGIRSQSNVLLPEKQTDFIFAVIGEEFGFIGALIILILLVSLVIYILVIAFRANDNFGYLICIGVAAMLGFQIVENIGMCLAMLPVIGITLPLISYGGSSIVSVFCALGIVLCVQKHPKFQPLQFYK